MIGTNKSYIYEGMFESGKAQGWYRAVHGFGEEYMSFAKDDSAPRGYFQTKKDAEISSESTIHGVNNETEVSM